MSRYSVKNMKEIEDSAGARVPQIEGRFAPKHLDSRELGVSYFRYTPGFHASIGHSHREQEEAYVVVGGSGRVKLDDEIIDLSRWDVLRAAPEVVRAFQGGPEGSSSSPSAPQDQRRGTGIGVHGGYVPSDTFEYEPVVIE